VGLAPGLSLVRLADARPPDQPVTDAHRWGLFIDATKCADGCSACVEACNQENGLVGSGRPATDAQWIRTVRLRDRATGHETRLPYMCQHCESPPCVDVCPTGASFRRIDGIVLVDRHICIGCRYCMMACPYKARSFIHEDLTGQKPDVPRGKGCVESCTLCVHRVDAGGRTTACAEACERTGHRAIVFGDLKDPKSEIYKLLTEVATRQIREDLQLNTGVRYHGI
jgi:molybdopterin-containing oxidoreductase family iron-sulfur binding subunit